ncbi:MAG TPA: VWA domain-containing protein [Kofleriaceae bacterium]|nr:VWA domain-containing protein [Kofleriaceae bacterium]
MTMTIRMRGLAAFAGAAVIAAACSGDVGTAGGAGDGGDGGGDGTGDGGGGGSGVGLGGAQDIGAFRALLDAGDIPGESTLDANGFFSEHFSELPPADCGDPLCLVGTMAVGRDWVTHADRAVLQISLSTPVDPSELVRKPLNLVVVVDTSGSMAEDDRIGFARAGLNTLIDELGDGDRVGLVTFSDDVTVRASLTEPSDRDALHAAADSLEASGGTNLHDGLERGFQLGLEAFDPERQNRVILVSDGLATTGIVDDASIQAMSDRYLSDGIGLTTIGVGLDFNVALMRGLSERGAGNFYFLEDAAAIAEVFREELDFFVTPLAFDVELDVAAESGWQIGEVVGTHYWTGSPRSGGVSLPAVFVASRESDQPGEYGRRGAGGAIFVEMVPTSGSVWDPSDALAALSLHYRLPGDGGERDSTLNVVSRPERGASPADVYLANESMAEHYSMYTMFVGLREATRLAAYSYDCALAALERLDDEAAAWQREFADEDIDADRQLIAQFEGNLREAGGISLDDGAFDGVCTGDADGYDDGYNDDCGGDGCADGYDGYDDGYDGGQEYACQAGGSARSTAAGWALIAIAVGAATRRRRRRAAGEGGSRTEPRGR